MTLSNTFLKIISVIIAIIVWFIVVTSEQHEVSFYVPIKFSNEPQGVKGFTDTNLISVLVKGPKMTLKNLTFNDIRVVIDLSNFKSGEYLYRIKPNDIILPSGISLIRVEPQDIKITIDKVVKKTVKVVPSFIGEVKNGYKIFGVSVTPNHVTAYGVGKKIKLIDSIETLPINISDLGENYKTKIGLKLNDVISGTAPNEVVVEIKITENIVQKEYSGIDVSVEGIRKDLMGKMKLHEKTVDIVVKGRSDGVDQIEELKPFLDLSTISKYGIYDIPVKIKVPEGVEVVSVKPQKIKVEVKK